MFRYGLFNILKFYKMDTYCEVCKLRFEVEPGFYFGAMYVSYAIIAGIFLIEWTIFYFLDMVRSELILYLVPLTAILLLPWIFRYSRAVFLYVFGGIKFDDSYTNE